MHPKINYLLTPVLSPRESKIQTDTRPSNKDAIRNTTDSKLMSVTDLSKYEAETSATVANDNHT